MYTFDTERFCVLDPVVTVLAESFSRAQELLIEEAAGIIGDSGLGEDSYEMDFKLHRIRYSMEYEIEKAISGNFNGIACPTGSVEKAFVFICEAEKINVSG